MQHVPRHQPGRLAASVPALRGIEGILTDQEIAATIRSGKGRMPPFNSLSDEQVEAVVHYLTRAPQQQQRRPAADPVAAEAATTAPRTTCPIRRLAFVDFLIPKIIRQPRRPGEHSARLT